MKECIFCKIARGEVESEKIYETKHVVSFLDINPKSPGHALIIPRKHFRGITDMDDDLVSNVFTATKKVVSMLRDALNPDAFTMGINDGEAAGQVVPHLHVNVIPRFEGDKGGSIHSIVDNPPSEEISRIAERIRNVGV